MGGVGTWSDKVIIRARVGTWQLKGTLLFRGSRFTERRVGQMDREKRDQEMRKKEKVKQKEKEKENEKASRCLFSPFETRTF